MNENLRCCNRNSNTRFTSDHSRNSLKEKTDWKYTLTWKSSEQQPFTTWNKCCVLFYLQPIASLFSFIKFWTITFPKQDIATVLHLPVFSVQSTVSLFPHSKNLHWKFCPLEPENSRLQAPANFSDHTRPQAVFNFMDNVYSRRPPDLPNSPHPHTALLVCGKLLQLFSFPNFPFSRFLFVSSFPTVMELRVVHASFPQWFWFADKSQRRPSWVTLGWNTWYAKGSPGHTLHNKIAEHVCVLSIYKLIEMLIT